MIDQITMDQTASIARSRYDGDPDAQDEFDAGYISGVTRERARFAAVARHPETAGRETEAAALFVKLPNASAEQIITVLAATPRRTAAQRDFARGQAIANRLQSGGGTAPSPDFERGLAIGKRLAPKD